MPKKRRKRAPKRELKQKLSLTVSPEMRIKAKKLARKQHRSISSLFEYLVSMEDLKLKNRNGRPYDLGTDTGIYHISQRSNGD
jgi:hypothetical protein